MFLISLEGGVLGVVLGGTWGEEKTVMDRTTYNFIWQAFVVVNLVIYESQNILREGLLLARADDFKLLEDWVKMGRLIFWGAWTPYAYYDMSRVGDE